MKRNIKCRKAKRDTFFTNQTKEYEIDLNITNVDIKTPTENIRNNLRKNRIVATYKVIGRPIISYAGPLQTSLNIQQVKLLLICDDNPDISNVHVVQSGTTKENSSSLLTTHLTPLSLQYRRRRNSLLGPPFKQ